MPMIKAVFLGAILFACNNKSAEAPPAVRKPLEPWRPGNELAQPAQGNPHADVAKAAAPAADIKVSKAPGADGRTVAEVWSQKASLKGKKTTVHGQVVKYMAGVMGSNWLHVRDGSGSEAGKDNDLTVTTKDEVAVGDIVTLSGNLSLDRDFGAGYTYAVIVEGASVTKDVK